MKEKAANVIVIPAKPELAQERTVKRQLRVAAYCRVSTDDEEQLTSYEAQQAYYTDMIMTNKEWTMAGIFADEGITGTSARKRPEFMRMIRMCRQGKIDIVLTKSISRFARNTVDCLNYIRVLKEHGIAVIFEKENINTLESDSEILITMMGAFAQAESESISANVRWGIRQAMREGKASIHYEKLYAYRRGKDDKPEIIPEEAEVVREIYKQFLAGASIRMIKDALEEKGICSPTGQKTWSFSRIRSILTNEKYCGDVLLQKTYVKDCISHKSVQNTGDLPMYLIQDHHQGIVDRETFYAVKAELDRRSAAKSPSKNAPTGRTSYASKYALSERLVCSECGTLYRRCTWTQRGEKRPVWRCVSRLDYGKKYCHKSPTMDEGPLQQAIMTALNSLMRDKDQLIRDISGTMEKSMLLTPGEHMSLSDIDERLEELNQQTGILIAQAAEERDVASYTDQLRNITNEAAALKEKRAAIGKQRMENASVAQRITDIAETMETLPSEFIEWEEQVVRQMVETVKVESRDRITIYLHGGIEIKQDVIY